MIVSYRDAGIGMVGFGMMMIGIILMIQTAFECLSRYGINKEKRKQDSGGFSHGIISGTPFSRGSSRISPCRSYGSVLLRLNLRDRALLRPKSNPR
jgi:hypothetical protein